MERKIDNDEIKECQLGVSNFKFYTYLDELIIQLQWILSDTDTILYLTCIHLNCINNDAKPHVNLEEK